MTTFSTVPTRLRRRMAAGLRVVAVLLPLTGAAMAHADGDRVPGDHGNGKIHDVSTPDTDPPGGPSGVTAPPGGPSGVTAPPAGPSGPSEPSSPTASTGGLAHTGAGGLVGLGSLGAVLITGGAAAAKLGRRSRRH